MAARKGWPLAETDLNFKAFSVILDELAVLGEQVSLEPFGGDTPDRVKLINRRRKIPPYLLLRQGGS